MTLEAIKALSDRELSFLVCEKVLGWHKWPKREGVDHDEWSTPDGDCVWEDEAFADGEPSQSLDAIWPLQEKTVEKFGQFEHERALFEAMGDMEGNYIICASARQRAEAIAFLWTQEDQDDKTTD